MTQLPDWAVDLGLEPHPEGGFYRQTWVSDLTIPTSALPDGYPGERAAGTAILFLLLPGQHSAWHTVRSAEIWLHHRGSPVALGLGGQGSAPKDEHTVLVGSDVLAGQHPQYVVTPGQWQRATPQGDEPSLVSCIVVPGFDFADFAMG
jgi:predicted cupin superfamily sugar epimerase